MARRVYVHIGAPKTGSTFLQGRLFANKAALAEQGVCLPGVLADHFHAKLFLAGQLDGDHAHPPTASTAWSRLLDELHAWPDTGLLTHELFSGLDRAAVEQLIADLAPAEVHVIYAARDLLRQIPAEWQEHVKHGRTIELNEFVADLMAEGEATRWFRHVQDPPGVLERWSSVPSLQRHLLVVPPAGSDPDLLWQRFCELVGYDDADFTTQQVFGNESLGVAEAELLRRVNTRLAPRLQDAGPGQVPRWIKTELAHSLLSKRPTGPRLTVHPDHREWAVRRSHEIVEQLKHDNYHVIGDLNDLIPQRTDQPAGDPSAVADDELLDVSVDTVTELVMRLRRTTNQARARAAELEHRKSRPVRQMLIDLSERHRTVHFARRVYQRTVNVARKLRPRRRKGE